MNPTAEQARILDAKGASFRVRAGAGSGKTTTMSHYMRRAIEEWGVPPEVIIFVTFTRFAGNQIASKLEKIMEASYAGMMCGTFHSVIYRLSYRCGLRIGESKHLMDATMDEGVRQFLTFMESGSGAGLEFLSKFRILAVDEFQDIDESQFNFIKLFKRIQPQLQVIAIGDLAQNIYRFRGTSNMFLRRRLKEEIVPELGDFTLTTNFRSTKNILEFVNQVFSAEIREDKILPMVPPDSAKAGLKPVYYEFAVNQTKGWGDYEVLVAKTLALLIDRSKKERKSFCIITPILNNGSMNTIQSFLMNECRRHGFRWDLHQIAKEDETCSTLNLAYEIGPDAPIQISTIHSSKGLEWDIVALVNFSDDMFHPMGEESDMEEFEAEKTNLSYVGITRAAEELHIFANANKGGRHRHLARLGEDLDNYVDFYQWGDAADPDDDGHKKKPVGVSDLLRKLPQHPDLMARVTECVKHVESAKHDGIEMERADVYDEFKARNIELALGTYVDWKLKKMVCGGQSSSVQDYLLDLLQDKEDSNKNFFWKDDAYRMLEGIVEMLSVYFANHEMEIETPIENYVSAVRIVALYNVGLFLMNKALAAQRKEIEKVIMVAAQKGEMERIIQDEFILSQAFNFFAKGRSKIIQMTLAPPDMYVGIPLEFEEFIAVNIGAAAATLRTVMKARGCWSEASGALKGDVGLETRSLIYGAADIVSGAGEGMVVEMKCSMETKAEALRDVGACKNLLQVFTYVAMGRHGVVPLPARWGCLVNPLTGTWEMYDMNTWTTEQSAEFMACLEELRERTGGGA